MKLVFLFGNCAVGKMTVGQALCDITRLKLFHNHMTIEPVIALFGDYKPRAVARLRDVIFEEFAASDQYGMVFTYMWISRRIGTMWSMSSRFSLPTARSSTMWSWLRRRRFVFSAM